MRDGYRTQRAIRKVGDGTAAVILREREGKNPRTIAAIAADLGVASSTIYYALKRISRPPAQSMPAGKCTIFAVSNGIVIEHESGVRIFCEYGTLEKHLMSLFPKPK